MTRTELREHVFKILFQIEFYKPEEMPEHLQRYLDDLEDEEERYRVYIREKYEKIVKQVPEIDAQIDRVSTGWKTKRMNRVDLAILRLAVYEMKWDEDIPVSVAINEAVELAKRFSSEEAPAFINGVLARLTDRKTKREQKTDGQEKKDA